ncbi:GNAT family N-acetyltransferase [Aerococcaceae bacterium DSM 111020]|nr:GNAT family N-acetyltransferase [Aerococcaceae bacterium DSM 111020]
MENIKLVPLKQEDLKQIWVDGYSEQSPDWKQYDAPFIDDYHSFETAHHLIVSSLGNYLQSDAVRGIVVKDQIIGIVSRHWIDYKTRWLEVGIVIYQAKNRGHHFGIKALSQWITETFESNKGIQYLGLTTWSGNKAMIQTAEKIGLLKMAHIPRVIYWNDEYYDHLKYGVLREDWFDVEKTQKSTKKHLE